MNLLSFLLAITVSVYLCLHYKWLSEGNLWLERVHYFNLIFLFLLSFFPPLTGIVTDFYLVIAPFVLYAVYLLYSR